MMSKFMCWMSGAMFGMAIAGMVTLRNPGIVPFCLLVISVSGMSSSRSLDRVAKLNARDCS